MSVKYDLCIIGSGPAAHTCAIYASRAKIDTVMFEGWMAGGIAAGGQLTTTSIVENFPGFPGGIQGGDLCRKFRDQSIENGAKIYSETVVRVDKVDGGIFKVSSVETTVYAKAVVVATGAVAKRLNFEGSNEYWNSGISACAVCDGAAPIFRGKHIAVVGGGDTAMEEALFLTKYASHVYVIVRSSALRASKVMQERVLKHSRIQIIWNANVVKASGSNGLLTHITVQDGTTGNTIEMQVNGLFYAIGHVPASDFVKHLVKVDDEGYIVTAPGSTKTNVPGVFAAGDVQDKKWRQAITAAASGCVAALEVEAYLHGR